MLQEFYCIKIANINHKYIKQQRETPIIPNTIPAFPNLLLILCIDLTPKTIAKIPVINDIYQNIIVSIDMIPNVNDAAGIPE